MGTKPPESEGINNGHINRAPTEEELTEYLDVRVTPFEKEFLTDITSLLHKIDVDGKKLLAKDNTADLLRTCLTYTTQVYMASIFSDPSIVKRLPNKDTIKEFIAFRKKYMNYPIDAQLTELKRMGIVKAKQQKT